MTQRLDASSRNLIFAYGLATLGAGLLLSSQLLSGDALAMPLKLLSFMLLLFTVWRWPGALLLIGLQGYLFFREPRSMMANDPVGVTVIAWLGLMLVLCVSRLRTLLQTHAIEGIGDWLAIFRGGTEEGSLGDERRKSPDAFLREAERRKASGVPRLEAERRKPPGPPWLRGLIWVAVSAVACIATAAIMLWLVPLESSSQRNLRLTPTGLRTIQIAFLLATTSTVVAVFVSELLWRRQAPAQARIYLLSSMTSWITHDLQMVLLRRQRKRRRDARRQARKSTVSKES